MHSSVYEQWLVGDMATLEEPFLDRAINWTSGQLTGMNEINIDKVHCLG